MLRNHYIVKARLPEIPRPTLNLYKYLSKFAIAGALRLS